MARRLKVERLDERAWPEWDRFVAGHPSGMVCQRTGWLVRVGDELRVHAVVDGGGAMLGGVALVETRRHGVRGFHIPPYTPYFGPLVMPSKRKRIAARRSEEHKILGVLLDSVPPRSHVDFRLPPGLDDIYPYYWRGFTPSVVYTHEISGAVEDYARNVAERRRTYLRRMAAAVEDGRLVIEVGREMEPIIELWGVMGRRKRIDPRIGVLRQLADADTGGWQWTTVLARDAGGRLLAGVALATDGRRALNLVNVSAEALPEGLEQATLAAIDRAIRYVLERGMIFDCEGSMLRGVEASYRLFGGLPRPNMRLQRSRSTLYFVMRMGAQFMAERRGRRS